jgi:hypothetical protein
MTKIPAHPKFATAPLDFLVLGAFCPPAWMFRSVSTNFSTALCHPDISSSWHFQSPKSSEVQGNRHIQTSECCNLWVHSTTSLKTRPQSLTRPPAAAGSGRANGSLIAKSGSRSPVAEAGLVNHRLSCPAKSFPALSGTAAKTDHHSSRRSRLVFSGLRGGIQFEGKSSRVGGAGQGRCSCDPSKAASRVHACVQRPAPEGFEGTSATGIEVTPPGTPGRGCSTRLLYLPHPFSTQGVWTRATLQKRFALPKDRPTADQST